MFGSHAHCSVRSRKNGNFCSMTSVLLTVVKESTALEGDSDENNVKRALIKFVKDDCLKISVNYFQLLSLLTLRICH